MAYEKPKVIEPSAIVDFVDVDIAEKAEDKREPGNKPLPKAQKEAGRVPAQRGSIGRPRSTAYHKKYG